MQDNHKVLEILEQIRYATIATVDENNKPWNTPVFSAYDQAFNIYWSSLPASVHSQNIARDGNVFISIYNSKAGDGEGMGIYMVAKAQMLENKDDILKALKFIGERAGRVFDDVNKFMSEGSQRIYKATPSRVWLNGTQKDEDGDFIKDFRREVILKPENNVD